MSVAAVREIPFARPWITDQDRKAVLEVLEGPVLTHGPQGKAFEAEFSAFLGQEAHSVSLSSCMAALHLSYIHFGIGPGDEVIVPAQTHTATAHAVEWVGAKPIFVDCDPRTGNLTAERIALAVTPRTKAISVVHFVGIPCPMPDIMALAKKHRLVVVEDCAIALGARWEGRHVGLFGHAGCFSFYPVKHITTGEGGMLVTKYPEVAEGIRKLRAFGVDRTYAERTIPGMYDVPSLGLNYRMSELQAALGRTQLSRMDENMKLRRTHFDAYQRKLSNVPHLRILETGAVEAQSSPYCWVGVLEGSLAGKRNKVVMRLNAAGIGTSIYYPQPVPRMSYYRNKYGYEESRYFEAAQISDHSVALPVGPHLNEGDVQIICEGLLNILKEVTA